MTKTVYIVNYHGWGGKPWGIFDDKERANAFYEYLKSNFINEDQLYLEEKELTA